MARTRGFQEDEALERALHVFWNTGYEAASMDDLLAATGLSKSSLYQAFGSKQRLLVACLKLYARLLWSGPLEPIARDDAGRAEIEETFRRIVARAVEPEGHRGCFVNSCLAEVAPRDPAILRATRLFMSGFEEALARAVERGQRDGTIALHESPRAIARFLLNTVSGLNLAAKARPPRARVDDIVRVAMRSLD